MLKVAIAIAILISMQCHAETSENEQPAKLPSDVAGFIARRASCLDWIDKFQKGHGTAADYEKTISELRCDTISEEQLHLRLQYALQPEVVAAIDAVWIKIVRRVPAQVITLPR